MRDDPIEAVRLLKAELAHMRALSASLEKLGAIVPPEVAPAIVTIEAQIADLHARHGYDGGNLNEQRDGP